MIEVLTPSGFQPFLGIRKKVSSEVMEYKGTACTMDHRFVEQGELAFAKDLGYSELYNDYVYDLIEVEGGHLYLTDDKVSHNCEFQGSSDTLLSPATLQRLTFQEPVHRLGDNRELLIYKTPEPGHNYVLTVDVSEGVGKDYSVISIIDVTQAPYQQCVMMRSNIMSPLLLADLVDKTGRKYNEAYVVVESNTYGKQVVDALWMDYEYENLMLSRGGNNDAKLAGARNEKIAPGVKTTKKTKQIGCSSLKGLIESNQLILYDFETLQELNSFSKKGNSYEAEKGKTDDIVMSLVIFAWFAAQPYFNDTFDQNTRDIVRSNILQDAEYHTAFGFMDDGLDDGFDWGWGKTSKELFETFQ